MNQEILAWSFRKKKEKNIIPKFQKKIIRGGGYL